MTAAYIASRLFNDWRDEKEYELTKESSLSLLKATLNINSTIENFLAITFEFLSFENEREFKEYCNWCDQFSRDFMNNLIIIKTENNLHHGLVLDFENEEKLFSFEDLSLAHDLFNKIAENVEITVKNYTNNDNIKLNKIDLKEYSKMINIKIVYLNAKCKPPKDC